MAHLTPFHKACRKYRHRYSHNYPRKDLRGMGGVLEPVTKGRSWTAARGWQTAPLSQPVCGLFLCGLKWY